VNMSSSRRLKMHSQSEMRNYRLVPPHIEEAHLRYHAAK